MILPNYYSIGVGLTGEPIPARLLYPEFYYPDIFGKEIPVSKRGDKIIDNLEIAIAFNNEHDIKIWIDRLRKHIDGQRSVIQRLTDENKSLKDDVWDLSCEIEEMHEYD